MSPVKIKKVDGYRVSTPHGVKAKSTTKKKAESQKKGSPLCGTIIGVWGLVMVVHGAIPSSHMIL